MEISVGFADKDKTYYLDNGYTAFETEIGNAYIPLEQVEIADEVAIRYERHPWIESFEVDGVVPKPIKRMGYGDKDMKGFVKSLSTIYAKAYEDFETCTNYEEYFVHAAKYFVDRFINENETKMFKKFCGFVENMWREGNKEMCDIALEHVLPFLAENEATAAEFQNAITDEFRAFINK